MLMREWTICGLLFLLGISCSVAQTSISGRVLSQSEGPLENVHVLLCSEADSTILSMGVTDSLGQYVVSVPNEGCSFFVDYSLIGFKTHRLFYDETYQSYQRVLLEEDATALGEVVVMARQVRTQPITGGIECRILNRDLVSNRSIIDLISYVPMVSKVGLDQYQVSGTDDVVFFINGRRSLMSGAALMSYLRSLSATQIKSIKVLYQPPLEYGVGERTAVIDMLIDDDNVGFQGTLRGEVTRTRYWKETASSTLVYQAPQWQVQMFVSARNLRDYEKSESGTAYLLSDIRRESEQRRDTRRRQYDFNLTGEYKLADNHTLAASVDMYYYGGKPRISVSDRYLSNGIDSTFLGVVHRDYTDRYLGTNLYYKGMLPKGIQITAELNGLWSDYQSKISQRYKRSDLSLSVPCLDYEAKLPMVTNSYLAKVQLKILLARNVYVYMGNNSSFYRADYQEKYDVRRLPHGYRLEDQTLRYDEIMHLPYLLAYTQLPYGITLYGGLYAQHHMTQGAYDSDAVQRYANKWYLLPYFSTSWTRDKLSLSYGFSMSNSYPSFAGYSPFKKWNSMNDYTQGNPELRPSRSLYHTLTARYHNLYGQLYYGHTRDAIETFSLLDGDRVIASKSYNYGEVQTLNLSMGYSGNITSWWFVNGNVSVNRYTNRVLIETLPQQGTFHSWYGSGSINNAFQLSERHNWSADVNFSYSTPYRGIYRTEKGLMQCNLMMSKSIGDNVMLTLWGYKAWRHSLNVGIHSWGFSGMQTSELSQWTKSWGEDMGISLSLAYYFGKESLNRKIQSRRSDASRVVSEQ